MKVKDLIEELKKRNPEAHVFWPLRSSFGLKNDADRVETVTDIKLARTVDEEKENELHEYIHRRHWQSVQWYEKHKNEHRYPYDGYIKRLSIDGVLIS